MQSRNLVPISSARMSGRLRAVLSSTEKGGASGSVEIWTLVREVVWSVYKLPSQAPGGMNQGSWVSRFCEFLDADSGRALGLGVVGLPRGMY